MSDSRPGYFWDHLDCQWAQCPEHAEAGRAESSDVLTVPSQATTVEAQPEADVRSW